MTGATSRPGICFFKLRDGHSPSTPLGRFPDPLFNVISSWYLRISQWDFSHALDLCRCLQWSLPLRHVGFISLDFTFCRAYPYFVYCAEDQSHPTHTHTPHKGDLPEQGWPAPCAAECLENTHHGRCSPYLCSYSLIFTYNLLREALSPTLSAQGSPVQPLPRATQIKFWLLFISSLSPNHQIAADWGYAANPKYRGVQNLFPAVICLIKSPLHLKKPGI